jgi:methylenetetrahydrofolate reductase (NADPH)
LRGNCDAVNLTDNQTAIVRMSSIAAGSLLLQEGLEPIIQMVCRDRNRLAMQSDLMGAYALGIRNLLCLTGDHQTFGNHPTAKNVFDLDSIQMIRMVKDMRDDKVFQCGEQIKGVEPRFFVGAAAAPFAGPTEFAPIAWARRSRPGPASFKLSLYMISKPSKFSCRKFARLACMKKSTFWPGLVH